MSKSYKISKATEGDLIDIAHYGEQNFGPDSSARYMQALSDAFDRLSSTPGLGSDASEYLEGYRRLLCQNHWIYYRMSSEDPGRVGGDHTSSPQRNGSGAAPGPSRQRFPELDDSLH